MKLLIRTPNWLGDLLMSTAFIRAVLDTFPDATVDLIVRKGFEHLPLPHRGRLHAFDKTKTSAGAFGRTLRSESYDRIYLLPPSFSAAWMAFRAQIPERYGLTGGGRRLLLKPALELPWPPSSQHLIEEYAYLLGQSASGWEAGLEVDADWLAQQTLPFALPERFVAVAAGAIYGPAKEWPTEHFQEVVQQLAADGWPVLILGTEKDREQGEVIRQGHPEVINACGQTNLNQLVRVLAQSALLISNDSGAMHVMAALRRPQLALFGSTSPTWTRPLNAQARLLSLHLDCSPCFARSCPLGHTNCLRQLLPEAVLSAAREQLATSAPD